MFWLIFSALVCLGEAQVQYGYQGSPAPFPSISDNLDAIESSVDAFERAQAAQNYRIANIRETANDNFGVINNFPLIYHDSEEEQQQQNGRLDRIVQAISQMQDIRSSLSQLNEAVDGISERIVQERKESRVFRNEINRIQSDNVNRSSRIGATEQRADAVNSRIDSFRDYIFVNTGSLEFEELNVRRIIVSLNRQRSSERGIQVRANDVTTVDFDPEFIRTPNFNMATLMGFSFNNPRNYANSGYPSIDFGIEEDVWNNRTEISAYDMSMSNWRMDRVNVLAYNAFFDVRVFPKNLLDGIVTTFTAQ